MTCRLVVVLVALAACGSQEPVRIGLVVSSEAVAGARVAMEEINESGGIGGRQLALTIVQSGGATGASLAIAQAESLVADPAVIGVVGHSNSSSSLTAAQIYNARGVVQIAPTSSSPLLSRAGSYTFRLVPSDVHQARFLSTLVTAGAKRPRVAVFFVNDDYGRALRTEFMALLSRAAVPIVYEARYLEGDSLRDVTSIARVIAGSRPDVLTWLGRAPQLGNLLPALRQLAPNIRVLASDGVDNAATERNVGGAMTGLQFACFADPMSSRPRMSTLRKRFQAMTGAPVNVEATLTYDAVMLLAESARAVGPDRKAVRDYLASVGTTRPSFEGASGAIGFDDQGDARPAYCLAEITPTGRRTISSPNE